MENGPEIERRNKILAGLKIAYARMLEFKRQKNSELIIMRDDKILRIRP